MENLISSLKDVLPALNPELFSKPNVVATGIGYKKVKGRKTEDLCIICSVNSKVESSQLTSGQLIPSTIGGFPTDVNSVGSITALQLPTSKFRPAPGGVSTGHVNITAGTLGCLVEKEGKNYILSNNHVLANSNNAIKGDMVLQPGPHDGGTFSNDQIGKLTAFVPIIFENDTGSCGITNTVKGLFNLLAKLTGSRTRLFSAKIRQESNLVDCAIAEPLDQADVVNEILQIGKITGEAEGILGMAVKKSGRTTGLTSGEIEQVYATIRVNFGGGKTALFTDQLISGAMSQGGDSGSAVLNNDNKVVGLLFAGSTNTTVINRIQNVLQLLEVNLI